HKAFRGLPIRVRILDLPHRVGVLDGAISESAWNDPKALLPCSSGCNRLQSFKFSFVFEIHSIRHGCHGLKAYKVGIRRRPGSCRSRRSVFRIWRKDEDRLELGAEFDSQALLLARHRERCFPFAVPRQFSKAVIQVEVLEGRCGGIFEFIRDRLCLTGRYLVGLQKVVSLSSYADGPILTLGVREPEIGMEA